MNFLKWFRKKPSVEVVVKQGKNDRWRWQMLVDGELYAVCPVYGFSDYVTAKNNAIYLVEQAGRGYYISDRS